MQMTLDIPQEQIDQLNAIARDQNLPAEDVARSVIAEYLEQRPRKDTLEAAFGMWADRGIDGLEYERALRAEWDREF